VAAHTIYEAIHYAVFSNILLFSAIRVYLTPDQHHCHNRYTVFPQCHRPNVTLTVMKILHKYTHIYISIVMLPERKVARYYEVVLSISPN